jgi:hypothetical protein
VPVARLAAAQAVMAGEATVAGPIAGAGSKTPEKSGKAAKAS